LYAALTSARRFTERLLHGVPDDLAARQFDPLFSPIAWHFGHIVWQEEVWVLRRAAREPPIDSARDGVFDSFVSPKHARAATVPPLSTLHAYAARVRERTLAFLERAAFDDADELLRDGYVFRFIANHERQHAELIGIVRLLGEVYGADDDAPLRTARCSEHGRDYLSIAGGVCTLGARFDPDAWDNEMPVQRVELTDFAIQRSLVTSGQWLEFMAAGGYENGRLWSDAGNAYRTRARLSAPLLWQRDDDGAYRTRTLAGLEPVGADRAVSHVSWYEAEAFARFAGARLPSEVEWEHAARSAGHTLEHPTGSVWQWTSSLFRPYPGFRAQPYRGYSEPWFDDRHRVARGGSFLTEPEIARPTFRNWYLPEIRQVPLGLRLARP
jgi:iron(II)-dependent oxidoreductase